MADDFLTIDEVASRLALPLEMIQRRIESGDIPVHWVEIAGKLEMRVSAAEIGVESPAASAPFPLPEGVEPEPADQPAEEPQATGWNVRDSSFGQTVWTPGAAGEPVAPEAEAPPGAAPAQEEAEVAAQTPWEVSPDSDLKAAELGKAGTPVWKADPTTWEDEPLHQGPAQPATAEADVADSYTPPGSDAFFPLGEESAAEATPVASNPGLPYLGDDDEEESAPFAGDDEEEATLEVTEIEEVAELPLPGPELAMPSDVPRPSALAAAQGPESALALNSLDARELVAGLFERWERALEQRIQAEQRLRFEAELERRMRQVRDLRQELDNSRKATAAQLAEREQEVMALRNKLRDQDQAPRGRGLFRR